MLRLSREWCLHRITPVSHPDAFRERSCSTRPISASVMKSGDREAPEQRQREWPADTPHHDEPSAEFNPQAFHVFGPKIVAMRKAYDDQALRAGS